MSTNEIPLGESTQLTISIPKKGATNWAEQIKKNFFDKVVAHNHDGNGNGAKVSVKNLEGVNISDIEDGEIMKWSASANAFIADDLVVDITGGTADTTKTAFQVYNANTNDAPLQVTTSENSVLTDTQFNSSAKIDTRSTALNIPTGKYTTQRAGTYDLDVNALVKHVDTSTAVNIAIRKTDSNSITSTIYSKKCRFDSLDPIGTVKAFMSDKNPNLSGDVTWLECDGSALDAATYPLLSTALAQKSSLNGTTLPNLQGTHGYLRGVDPGTDGSNLGDTQDDTTSADGLTITQAGSNSTYTTDGSGNLNHTHDVTDPGNYATNNSYGGSGANMDPSFGQTHQLTTDNPNQSLNHTHDVDIDWEHTHSINGASETAPNSTKVKYWIKARHASQPVELSVLANLDVDDVIYVNITKEVGTDITNLQEPELDLSNEGEGFLFKGLRIL